MTELLTFILVIVFASSSWLSTNAIWMELTFFTQFNPEGWTLPSYLSIVIQVACVGPLVYSIVHKCTKVNVPKQPLILVMLLFCAACMFCLAFTWDHAYVWFGARRSVPLIVLTFLMAIVNATSNVLFLPHMATYHPTYLTAYFVGMSFSSLIPSVMKLLQGTNSVQCLNKDGLLEYKNAEIGSLFSVRVYFSIMGVWLILTAASFAILEACFSTSKLKHDDSTTSTAADDRTVALDGEHNENKPEKSDEIKPIIRRSKKSRRSSDDGSEKRNSAELHLRKERTRFYTLIACLSLICALMNTVVPSIQSYATLPYSLLTYHLALTLNNITHPVANFLPLWLKPKQLRSIFGLTAVSTLVAALIFVLALQSPTPIFLHTSWGGSIPIAASVVFGFMASYLRVHITGVLRSEHSDDESRLFWCGLFMQIGSFIGASFMFPIVNVWKVFERAPPQMC